MYIPVALCHLRRSKSLVLGSKSIVLVPMHITRAKCQVWKVPEYRTGFLCIYIGLYGRWEGPRVTFWVCMDISRALC